MTRTCVQCQQTFETGSSRARFCSSTCRGRAHRGKEREAVVVAISSAPSRERLADVIAAEFEEAGIGHTSDARLCLILAERIDSIPESSPGLSSLSKELSTRKAELLNRRAPKASLLDELATRRARRRSS
jgi:hypothetical protein